MSADTTLNVDKRYKLQETIERVLDGFLAMKDSELTDTQFAPLSFGDYSLKNPTYWQIGLAFTHAVAAGEILLSMNDNPINVVLLSDSPYVVLARRDLNKRRNVVIGLINDTFGDTTFGRIAPQMIIDCVRTHAAYSRDNPPVQDMKERTGASRVTVQTMKADLTQK